MMFKNDLSSFAFCPKASDDYSAKCMLLFDVQFLGQRVDSNSCLLP